MPLIARGSNGGDFEPIEAGVHIAICYAVYDLGTHEDTYQSITKLRHTISIHWELPDCRGEFERDGKKVDLPKAASQRYTLSLDPKANLRKDLEAWRGKPFTAEQIAGFEMKGLLGKACQVQIIHTHKDDKTYANVAAIMSVPKGVQVVQTPENPMVIFSLDEIDPNNPVIPETVKGSYTRKLIESSEEWKAVAGNPQGNPVGDHLAPWETE